MNVSWRYRLRILATGLCFLIQNTYLTYSDALPFSIEDSGIVQNEDEEQITTGFFELQTLEFNTNKDRSPKNDPLSRDRTMTLSTKDLERYVDGKRRSMAVDYMKQAEEYIQNEEWDKASEEIDMALIRYPDSVELMGNAAMMYALIGNYAEASTLFRVYLQHHPDEVNHLAAWGGGIAAVESAAICL